MFKRTKWTGLLLFVAILFSTTVNLKAQVHLRFTRDGKLTGVVPERIPASAKFTMFVDGSNAAQAKVLADFDERCTRAKKWLKDSVLGVEKRRQEYQTVYGLVVNQAFLDAFDEKTGKLRATLEMAQREQSVIINNGHAKYDIIAQQYSLAIGPDSKGNDQGLIEFSLCRTDPYKSALFAEYSRTNTTVTPVDFGAITAIRRDLAKILADNVNLNKSTISNSDRVVGRQKILDELTALDKRVDKIIGDFRSNAQWFTQWLWYTGGVPTLNPFGFIDPATIPPVDTLPVYLIKNRISAREKVLKALTPTDTRSLLRVDSLITELNVLNDTLIRLTHKNQKLADLIRTNRDLIDDFRSHTEFLNRVKFCSPPDSNGKRTFMRNHDASRNFALMSPQVKEEYLERNDVVILNHNIARGHTIRMFMRYEVIENDRPDWVIATLDALDSAGELMKTVTATKVQEKAEVKDSSAYAEINSKIKALVESLNQKLITLQVIWRQSNPCKGLREREPDTANYYSQVYSTPLKKRGARIYYYSFQEELDAGRKVPADTFEFRVNKLYSILPAAGFAYTPVPGFVNVTLNGANTAPESKEIDYPVNFVVGLKYHFMRPLDIRSTKLFWEKDENERLLLLSRLSLVGMFNVLDPMSDQFLGVGLDVIPGLCLTAGAHFNKYTYYDFSGGTPVTKKMYRTGLYVGLLTDVAVVAAIVKLLGISK